MWRYCSGRDLKKLTVEAADSARLRVVLSMPSSSLLDLLHPDAGDMVWESRMASSNSSSIRDSRERGTRPARTICPSRDFRAFVDQHGVVTSGSLVVDPSWVSFARSGHRLAVQPVCYGDPWTSAISM